MINIFNYYCIFQKARHDEEHVIYIPHRRQTDFPFGDEFGATLRTFSSVYKDLPYYQHLLVDVKPKAPAEVMKIKYAWFWNVLRS